LAQPMPSRRVDLKILASRRLGGNMKRYLAGMALFLLASAASPLLAQDQSQDQSDPYAPYDSPGPAPSPGQSAPPESNQTATGMARLSFIHGDVSVQRGDNADWEAGTLNTPIAVGDRVSVGSGGRAEIQLDYANVLRLADGGMAKLAALSRENIQVQIGQGLATYSVLRNSEASAEIDTPNSAIHPNGPGDYRISVMPEGSTDVVVREGSAEISEPQGSTQVESGQMITVQGSDNPEYKISSAPSADAWDSWNQDRDRRIMNASSWRHTDPYYTGTQDLDEYGAWSEVPDYGPVWTPRQGPDWAPYSSGSWVWEPYWGWTWVSSEPWGWAPYHYGRWFVWSGNWVWWPGPVAAYPAYYPVWAPAYVSFFGWGGGGFGVGVGFGFGFGHVGWLPCGPGDWFHPWWGRWGGRYNAYNVTNIHNTTVINSYHDGFAPLGLRGEHSFSNVNQAFNNERVRSGFVSSDSNRFGRAGFSPQRGISAGEFRQASMVSGRVPFSPSRESYSAAGHAANPSSYRNAPATSQRFFTSRSHAGVGLNAQGYRSFGAPNNTARVAPSFGASRNSGAFSRTTPSPSLGSARSNRPAPVQSTRPGWHAFTPPSGPNRSSQDFSSSARSDAHNSPRSGFGYAQRQPQTDQQYNRSWGQRQPQTEQQFNRGRSQPNEYRPPASAPRSGYSNSYPSYSRPPLNMRQPVVTPRGGYGGAYSGGSRPSYSAPHGGGGYSSGGSHPSGGGGHSSGGSHGGGHH